MLPSDAFRYQINNFGRTLRLRYYTTALGSVWDDDRTLTLSGTDSYFSGLVLGIDTTEGSDDSVFLEQGRINYDDSKFYVAGSINTNSGTRIFTLTISGTNEVYKEITPGIDIPQIRGDDIYKKVYGRIVAGGSLF